SDEGLEGSGKSSAAERTCREEARCTGASGLNCCAMNGIGFNGRMQMHRLLPGNIRRGVCVSVLLALIGCRADAPYVVPEEPMPPNTVLLSQMMRELSATPGFTDALLAQMDKGEKKGPALMTPALMKRLRELILGKDWQGLDRFPGWTMQEVNPAVGVISRVVKQPEAAVGAPSGA